MFVLRTWAGVRFALLGLLVAVPAPALALDPARELNQYILEFYQQGNGLPSNFVFAACQTRDGYLWVGTRGGLARFDGVRFKVFDDTDATQFRESEIWSLEEGTDGSLWVGTFGGGLTRIKDGRFQIYGKAEGLGNEFVRALAAAPDGGVWVGTQGGVFRFAGERFTGLTTKDGLPSNDVRSLELDAAGRLFVGTMAGVATVEDGRVLSPVSRHPALAARTEALAVDPRGGMWIGTFLGLYRMHGETVTPADATEASRHQITGLAPDATGVVWAATTNGLYRYRGGKVEQFFSEVATTAAGRVMHMVSLRNLQGAFIDREGSLWVGTNFDGLARLRDAAFTNVSLGADETGDIRAACVFEDGDGTAWAGTRSGLTRVKDGAVEAIDAGARGSFNTIAQDTAGTIWTARDDGIYKLAGRSLVRVLEERLNPAAIVADRAGGLWIGARNTGLHHFDGRTLTAYGEDRGVKGRQVRALAQDSAGGLWVGFKEDGLVYLREGRVMARYGLEENLANLSVSALHVDGEGVVWVATRRGLNRIRDGKVAKLTTAEGLPANFFYQIVEDGLGHLWMPYGRGIMRVSKQDLSDVAEGRRKAVATRTFGTESGIKNASMIVPNQPTAWRGRDGRLWFATAKGLTMVDPARVATNALPPPVEIEQVRLDEGAPLSGPQATFAPGGGNVEIEYAAMSLVAPELVRFKYKLEGIDRDWIDAGTRRVAYYTGLPPGSYRFQVKACNNDGVWNEVGDTLALRLQPHWYQQRWLHALGMLAGLGLVYGAYRGRIALHERRERELGARVQEAVSHIKTLRGLLPICAACKKIRDDSGYWSQIEVYIHEHSEAGFSHGICPDCMQKLYPEYADASAKEQRRGHSS
jgi:ligand-binding sensor domain-containing protein